jgi:protein-tyrosine phosphatase
MKKILMVCLGNICRSPMAEGIMRAIAKYRELEILVDSAGTAAYHIGESPDARAVNCLQSHGISIQSLRARKFVPSDFTRFDMIFTMDQKNHDFIINMARYKNDRDKVRLFMSILEDPKRTEVIDPYYGGRTDFERVYADCLDATEAWFAAWELALEKKERIP